LLTPVGLRPLSVSKTDSLRPNSFSFLLSHIIDKRTFLIFFLYFSGVFSENSLEIPGCCDILKEKRRCASSVQVI